MIVFYPSIVVATAVTAVAAMTVAQVAALLCVARWCRRLRLGNFGLVMKHSSACVGARGCVKILTSGDGEGSGDDGSLVGAGDGSSEEEEGSGYQDVSISSKAKSRAHLGILSATGWGSTCADFLEQLADLAITELLERTILERLLVNPLWSVSGEHNI